MCVSVIRGRCAGLAIRDTHSMGNFGAVKKIYASSNLSSAFLHSVVSRFSDCKLPSGPAGGVGVMFDLFGTSFLEHTVGCPLQLTRSMASDSLFASGWKQSRPKQERKLQLKCGYTCQRTHLSNHSTRACQEIGTFSPNAHRGIMQSAKAKDGRWAR